MVKLIDSLNLGWVVLNLHLQKEDQHHLVQDSGIHLPSPAVEKKSKLKSNSLKIP